IKTGAARIAFGAEERNDFTLGVQIIPVGISYSDITKFHSNVTIRFGRPIAIADFIAEYRRDPVSAVQSVTGLIDTALHKLTLAREHLEIESVVESLNRVYKQELQVELAKRSGQHFSDFSVTKGLITAVEWFYQNEPDTVRQFQEKLTHYLRNLERLHVKDEFLQPHSNLTPLAHRLRMMTVLALGFPFYVIGLINNYVPYMIPRWYTRSRGVEKSMYATTKLVVGIASFLLYYAVILSLIQLMFHSWFLTTMYAVMMPVSGFFVLHYHDWVDAYRSHLTFLAIFYRKKQLIYHLIEERKRIMEELDHYRELYFRQTGLAPGKN
ncbi:MAG: hypothetical protein D6762_06580, partial [Candidatus Neomarinimicrobiota bacterium]